MSNRSSVRAYITRQQDAWGVAHLTAYEALWLRRIGDLEGPFADVEEAEAAALMRNQAPPTLHRPYEGLDTLLGN